MEKIKLPEDRENVSYFYDTEDRIVTSVFHDCGCEYQFVWEDITIGRLIEVVSIALCEDHDATMPWVEKEEEDE